MWGLLTMTPKTFGCGVEDSDMPLKFLAKGRTTANCKHDSVIRIEVAGMSREVCEDCGRVSLGYVEQHLQPIADHSAVDAVSGATD